MAVTPENVWESNHSWFDVESALNSWDHVTLREVLKNYPPNHYMHVFPAAKDHAERVQRLIYARLFDLAFEKDDGKKRKTTNGAKNGATTAYVTTSKKTTVTERVPL